MDKEKLPNDSIRPDIPGLKAMESNSKADGEAPAGGGAAEKGANPADISESLRGMEGKVAGKAVDTLAKTGGAAGIVARVLGAIGRNKGKSAIGGGAGLIVIMLLIFGFATITEFTLQTIEKDMLKYEDKVQSEAEEKASKSILKHIMCRALAGNSAASAAANCNKSKNTNKDEDNDPEDSEDEPEEQAEQQANADPSDDGASLASEMDGYDFTDPDIMQRLSEQGINVQTEDGKFDGFTDSSGNPITVDDLDDPAVLNSFETALPEFDVGQINGLETLWTEHAQASWNGLPDDENTDVSKDVDGEVINGADEEQIAKAEGENQPEEEPDGTPAAQAAQAAEGAADNNAMTTAAEKVIQNGGTEEEAEAAASESIDPAKGVLVSTIASDVCGVKKVADTSSQQRKPEIMKLAIRHIGLLFAIADQLKSGHIKSKTVSSFMTILDGDSSAKATIADPSHPGKMETNEASLPWSRSAAWLRISGKSSEVDTNPEAPNYTPDVDSSSLPTADAGNKVVGVVDTAVDDVGGGLLCTAEESPFGNFGNFFANAVQLVSGEFDFGLSDAAAAGGVTAVQVLLQHLVIPEIIKYFTPVNMFGGELSTQWLGIADMGANLGINDYFRSQGAMPVSNSSAGDQFALASKAEQQTENQQSFTDRTFALSNPDSLVAKLALDLPSSRTGMFSDISSYFTGFSQNLFSSFSSIFSPSSLLADPSSPSQNGTPGVAYGVTQYGMVDPTEYDPIANEDYLNTTVTYQGVSVKRITMLGDPMSYPNPDDDTSTTDVYHCFSQGFDTTADEISLDPICAGVGNYDYNNLTPSNSNNNNDITDSNIATSYCDYFANPSSPTPGSATQGCISAVMPQLHNDIGHFTQYIMDTNVMSNYEKIAGKTSNASSPTTGLNLNSQAAGQIAQQDSTGGENVGFALFNANGTAMAEYNDTFENYGASITKALILVAYLNQVGSGTLSTQAQGYLTNMIENSDNASANWVFQNLTNGPQEVGQVATQAGMTGFVLDDTSDPTYVLGQSQITARDFAVFFSKINNLITPSQQSFGLGLLSSLSASDQVGLLQSGLPGTVYSKEGWKPEVTGLEGAPYIVNQAAQFSTGGQTYGVAVTVAGCADQTSGEAVVQNIVAALIGNSSQ